MSVRASLLKLSKYKYLLLLFHDILTNACYSMVLVWYMWYLVLPRVWRKTYAKVKFNTISVFCLAKYWKLLHLHMRGPAKEDAHAIFQSGKESVKIEEFLKIYCIEQLSLKSSLMSKYPPCHLAHWAASIKCRMEMKNELFSHHSKLSLLFPPCTLLHLQLRLGSSHLLFRLVFSRW